MVALSLVYARYVALMRPGMIEADFSGKLGTNSDIDRLQFEVTGTNR